MHISFCLFAQEQSFTVGVGVSTNSHAIPVYTSISYNRKFNPYIGASGGIMFMSTKIKESWSGYYIDDDVYKLNGQLALDLFTPEFNNFGFYTNLSFMFELVPLDITKINKSIGEDYIQSTKFSKFNPAYFAEAGLSYRTEKLKFSLGLTSTNYDPFSGYRRVKINGNSIKSHIPDKAIFWGITFKIALIL